MNVKERIYEYCRVKEITIKSFEEKSGMSNGYVSSMRKGLGDEKLNNVLSAFPDLSREWLLYGEGQMLRQDAAAQEDSSAHDVLMQMIREKDARIEEMARQIGRLEAELALLGKRAYEDTDASGAGSAVAG